MSFLARTITRMVPVLGSLPKAAIVNNSVGLCVRQTICRSYSALGNGAIHLPRCTSAHKYTCQNFHTKGDRELGEFLQQEITEEKKNMTTETPKKLGLFTVSTNSSQVMLTRQFNDEEITVSIDVNHTVDAEGSAEMSADGQDVELKSRPNFEVDVKVGNKVMSFTCSYTKAEEAADELVQGQEEGQDTVQELFGINELTIYEGEFTEAAYCVSGDILDETLYDHLMNYLDERGITEEFVGNISDICTDYEHSQYVGLLEKLQDFVKK